MVHWNKSGEVPTSDYVSASKNGNKSHDKSAESRGFRAFAVSKCISMIKPHHKYSET